MIRDDNVSMNGLKEAWTYWTQQLGQTPGMEKLEAEMSSRLDEHLGQSSSEVSKLMM